MAGNPERQFRKDGLEILRIPGDQSLMTQGEGANQDVRQRPLGNEARPFSLDKTIPGFMSPKGVFPSPILTEINSNPSEKLVLKIGISLESRSHLCIGDGADSQTLGRMTVEDQG